jgi:hypothetical protein
MTVSSTTNRVTYSGNGSTTVFSFPYHVNALSDVVAQLVTTATGVIDTQPVYGVDYTVSGSAGTDGTYPSGVSVTMTVAPATGKKLSLYSDPSETQATHWTDTDTLKEPAFDKLTLMVQRLRNLLSRSVTLKEGYASTFDTSLPAALTANYALVVNSGGTGWDLSPIANSNTGTVTSVALTAPAEFSVSGGTVTTNGTMALSWASAVQNRVFAAPSGSSGTPSFRALVAADLPLSSINVNTLSSGAATSGYVPTANGSGGIAWAAAPGSGTVTSVALSLPAIFSVSGSPVTGSGTLTASLASQSAGRVFASPVGSSGTPSFRVLDPTDLPAMVGASSGSGGTLGAVPAPTAGQQTLFLRGDATWASPPQGTVTSVNLSTPAEFSVSGNPVTGSGTLTISKATQAANTVWAGPASGADAVSAFRALVAADLPLHQGATSIATGVRGAVRPAPAGQQLYFYRGDGTWQPGVAGAPYAVYAQVTDLPASAANDTVALVSAIPAFYKYDSGSSSWLSFGTAPTVNGTRAAPQSITAAGGITPAASVPFQTSFIKGNAAPITVTANPQIAAGNVVGQRLLLVGRDSTNTVTLSDGTGLDLNGACTLGASSSLELLWDGTNWMETNRNA